jgi:hypothetical protein
MTMRRRCRRSNNEDFGYIEMMDGVAVDKSLVMALYLEPYHSAYHTGTLETEKLAFKDFLQMA